MMNAIPPLWFTWDGEAMIPRQPKRADVHYVVGENYPLAPWEDRSQASHNQQFAFIAEAWRNLPEQYRDEPWAQSPEHLRKFGLIKNGFCNTQTYPCGTKAEAERWASNLRPLDEYSIVKVEGTTVFRFTAESQSRRAMGKKRFQESKQALMDWLDDLLQVERGTLEREAGRAA